MVKTYIIAAFLALIVTIAGGAYVMGKRADRASELQDKINTIQGIKDAQKAAGDCADDWFACLLRHRGQP